MSAGIYNILIEQHADYTQLLQVKDSGNLDITNYTFAGSIRERSQSSTSVDFTTAITDAVHGKFTISLTDTQTAAMKAGDYEYDVVMTDDSGIKTRLIQGIATVEPGITR